MFPAFTNVALLAGLAAVAAPILIHLLLRRRSQRLKFSTVQFFVKRDEQSMRKRKLRNLFLLAVRVMLFTLLALAFARPYLPNVPAVAAARKPRHEVIVLDRSASMMAQGTAGAAWLRSKAFVKQVLAALGPEDRAALITCPGNDAPEFVSPPVLARTIDDLAPGYGASDLSDGLRQAAKLAAMSPPDQITTVYVVSDLQRASAQNLATAILPRDVKLIIQDQGDRFAPNISVTELQLTDRNGPHAVIASFSDEKDAVVPFEFKVDGQVASAGELHLDSGAGTNLPLSIPRLAPGWHSAELIIQPKDALAADDKAFASILVPEPVRALVVEPHPGEKVWQETSFFITSALNPGTSENEMSASRFDVEKISISGLTKQLARTNAAAFIVLPGLKQISTDDAEALKTFVSAGGGLVLFLGPDTSANEYNTRFADLLPGTLGRLESTGEADAAWRLATYQQKAPMFLPFQGRTSGNLTIPEFTRRFSVEKLPGASVRAEFDDGVPVVLERSVGKGKVILVNTSADTEWTDWQKHKTFVPWLHATGLFLAGDSVKIRNPSLPSVNCGGESDIELDRKKEKVTVQFPDGSTRDMTTDDQGLLRDVPFELPGIYSVRNSMGAELHRLAANVPAAEADLSFMPPAEFEQQIMRSTDAGPRPLTAGLFGDPARGRELWRILLLAALFFLIFEPLLANKTAA